MKDFHFGKKHRIMHAIKELNLKESEVNKFAKRASDCVGQSLHANVVKRFKRGGKVTEISIEFQTPKMGIGKKPVKRAWGGVLGTADPASTIQSANQLLATAPGANLKKGGPVKRSSVAKDLARTALKVNSSPRIKDIARSMLEKGPCVKKMAIGGVGKIRKHQSDAKGRPMPANYAYKFLRDK